MDWDKLRIFHAVAEKGSLTHAGDVLHLSQSAVSCTQSANLVWAVYDWSATNTYTLTGIDGPITLAGCARDAKSARAARKAATSSAKLVSNVQRAAGAGMRRSTASVTTPSMPSLPIHRSRRLNPAANFRVAVPHSTNSPVGR